MEGFKKHLIILFKGSGDISFFLKKSTKRINLVLLLLFLEWYSNHLHC